MTKRSDMKPIYRHGWWRIYGTDPHETPAYQTEKEANDHIERTSQ